ncbi:MAG: type II CAAX endopeptidase family protein [Planctomycetota bacterium]
MTELAPAPAPPADPPVGLALLGGGCFLAVLALVRVFEHDASQRASVAIAGLVALGVLCQSPRVLGWLRGLGPTRLGALAAGLTLWTVVLPAERFDPYMLAIVLAATVACVHACASLDGRLTSVAVVVWLCLWLPLDLRWFRWQSGHSPGFYLGNHLAYNTWAVFTACLGVVSFGAAGRFDLGIQRASLRGPLLALGIGVVFGAIAIPVGLATGFLSFKSKDVPPAAEAPAEPGAQAAPSGPGVTDGVKAAAIQLVGFFVIALTIAFPEELFFRGILDRGLELRWKRPWVALAVSSVLFGLMHWNNRKHLDEQLVYLGLASLAGVAYGLAFRRGGLLAAIFLHALVDWVWQLAFSK